MSATTLPMSLRDLVERIGRQEPLHSLHGRILRAARDIRPVVESGAVLAACSDEFNGEVRSAFDRDVARLLVAPNVPGTRRVFSVSNLGGRIEPGAIALADRHFTAASETSGEKLLVIEITAHVGRREQPDRVSWGELDRFGVPSACCGALRLLLDGPSSAATVRYPWFDQLTAFFGPARLNALRDDSSPYRMVRAAVVHAVLQAETAIVDLLREPPTTPTHVLLLSMVVINRRGPDDALLVGVHHLHFQRGLADIRQGDSLRSTPDALRVNDARSELVLSSPFEAQAAPTPGERFQIPEELPGEFQTRASSPAVLERVEHGRRQLKALHRHPHALRIYARPLLRALLQGLSVAAPEVGLAALAVESTRDALLSRRMRRLLREGPSSEEARQLLHDVEPALQQLGHQEAREVLEILLSEHDGLFKNLPARP